LSALSNKFLKRRHIDIDVFTSDSFQIGAVQQNMHKWQIA